MDKYIYISIYLKVDLYYVNIMLRCNLYAYCMHYIACKIILSMYLENHNLC